MLFFWHSGRARRVRLYIHWVQLNVRWYNTYTGENGWWVGQQTQRKLNACYVTLCILPCYAMVLRYGAALPLAAGGFFLG